MTIGIPQALSYYYYYPLWLDFFEEIGFHVVSSGPTDRQKLDAGIKVTPSEACLPLKCYFGHLLSLMKKVDCIFIPRLVCLKKNPGIRLGCPKLIGLPDMARAIAPEAKILTTDIDLRLKSEEKSYVNLAQELGCSKQDALHAFTHATEQFALYRKAKSSRLQATRGPNGKFLIGLLGHAYLLNDDYLNLNLIKKTQDSGACIVNCHDLKDEELERAHGQINPLSWYFEEHILNAAYLFHHTDHLSGIIYLLSFGCGAGSITHEAIDYELGVTQNTHFLKIVLDEQTAETGLMTRIESFLDMIRLKEKRTL
jgi:predicted nucleotide-binding protein (sugar kinase/HSP70/actin superfamily)